MQAKIKERKDDLLPTLEYNTNRDRTNAVTRTYHAGTVGSYNVTTDDTEIR
jgi:hypothetical protein